jgi:tryptophan 2,3-dioxygenase
MLHVWPAMQEALNSRSIYDEVVARLARRGYEVDAAALDRDWAELYEPNPSVEKA